ncbi:MAG: DUF1810 domain-containing protein [Proteobacteria bacterium]|nr:DUF1810 domain-containing protein [Pseudomonadota bacterium]
MTDEHGLDRFVAAQAAVYETAVTELARGRKRSHWMWFVFPQLAGLGSSPTARQYAIRSLAEARAYLAHPLLGARLRACTQLALDSGAADAAEIFAPPDDLKFRSSMTLFALADPAEPLFRAALTALCGGEDARTRALLG